MRGAGGRGKLGRRYVTAYVVRLITLLEGDLARELGIVFEEGFFSLQLVGGGLHVSFGIGDARDQGVGSGGGALPGKCEQLPGVFGVAGVEGSFLPRAFVDFDFDGAQGSAVVEHESEDVIAAA